MGSRTLALLALAALACLTISPALASDETGTADLGEHAGVDCTIGMTRGGGVTSGGFVGFALRAKF